MYINILIQNYMNKNITRYIRIILYTNRKGNKEWKKRIKTYMLE